ncbi:hypothetical protein DVA43_02485 [Leclercia sp. W6]|uniref:hypothetical protein n=1 Tax=Leclercia sp. W6 TaxID=2282310 RepID=UPI000DF4C5CB|nr:hypothetical protein [Leclercia sp. W6]AXF58502.1 hypothetical protein DVA43_02485 [Leclercia sp. W6]
MSRAIAAKAAILAAAERHPEDGDIDGAFDQLIADTLPETYAQAQAVPVPGLFLDALAQQMAQRLRPADGETSATSGAGYSEDE